MATAHDRRPSRFQKLVVSYNHVDCDGYVKSHLQISRWSGKGSRTLAGEIEGRGAVNRRLALLSLSRSNNGRTRLPVGVAVVVVGVAVVVMVVVGGGGSDGVVVAVVAVGSQARVVALLVKIII